MPRKDLSEKQKRDQQEVKYYGHLRDLPKALLELVSNATYMCMSMAASMDGFLLAGMAAFLPKYFEYQFMLSPGNAAMLVGVLVVPAGAGGTLLGGYLGKRLRLDRAGYIKMYIVCQAVILPLYLGFLLYYPNADIAGVVADGAAVAAGGEGGLGCGDCACSRHGCQLAISRFLVRMCLALRASGLWLRYATLQNLILSFPWIAPPRPLP